MPPKKFFKSSLRTGKNSVNFLDVIYPTCEIVCSPVLGSAELWDHPILHTNPFFSVYFFWQWYQPTACHSFFVAQVHCNRRLLDTLSGQQLWLAFYQANMYPPTKSQPAETSATTWVISHDLLAYSSCRRGLSIEWRGRFCLTLKYSFMSCPAFPHLPLHFQRFRLFCLKCIHNTIIPSIQPQKSPKLDIHVAAVNIICPAKPILYPKFPSKSTSNRHNVPISLFPSPS